MEVQQLVRIARRGGAQEGQEGRQERRAAARAQVRAAGVSAEESGIYVSFPGCQASASWCTWGRTSSWRPAGDCWTPLSFYAASGGSKGCAQAHEKLGDGAGVRCGDGSAKHTARRAATCLGVARWRLRPGQRASARGALCKIARCAANKAADGRRVVGGGRGTSCGTCEAVRAPQGRNLTVLHAAAAVESRENLLRRMPRHLCIKINPAIRLISSSCARPYLGRLYILSENIIALGGTFPAI